MPLPTDEKALTLSRDLLRAFDTVDGGPHPGFRPVHAKGALFTGVFTPSPEAPTLSRAPHAQQASTPVSVRLSDFAGVPTVPDYDTRNASPRGCAIRFHLGEHVHTDIVSHSHNGFPSRTAEDFLDFLRALGATTPDQPHPNAIESYLGAHPKALEFVVAPKPIPTSFARESFFAVSAFKFTAVDGATRHGRYRILPLPGNEYLSDQEAAAKSPNFLFEEIAERIAKGHIKFLIVVQIAEAGDAVDDATIHWPAERRLMEFGEITLTARISDEDHDALRIIFDPIPRVDGIEPSRDPLFEPRANLYLLGGRRRREALAK
jgi:catalase